MLCRYPNLHEVRLIPTKKDIAFVEYTDEGSAGVAKDALHNYKLDGENKIKVCHPGFSLLMPLTESLSADYICEEMMMCRFCLLAGILFLRCTT